MSYYYPSTKLKYMYIMTTCHSHVSYFQRHTMIGLTYRYRLVTAIKPTMVGIFLQTVYTKRNSQVGGVSLCHSDIP